VALYRLCGYESTGSLTMSTGDPIGFMWRPVGAGRAAARSADGARRVAAA
jgi:hypothetical protein